MIILYIQEQMFCINIFIVLQYNYKLKLERIAFMYLDLSPKQILILEFIKEQIALKGYPPSVRETCEAVGLKSTIYRTLTFK